MTRRAGFTLIELLAVLGVLAILVAVAGTGGDQLLERARTARTASDTKVVVAAFRQYQADVGVYPQAQGDLASAPADAPGWRGPYLDRWPSGAAWDRAAVWSYEQQKWFDGYPGWGLAICSDHAPPATVVAKVDQLYDDGDPTSGTMRASGNCVRVYVGREP
jgi:general secretion pathway protein G